MVRVGMDVYAGPLSRYVGGDWRTVAEQAAEAVGQRVGHARPNGQPALTPWKAHGVAVRWQGEITRQIGRGDLSWHDDPAAPYATDSPEWDGYAGLLLLAAYDERPHLDPRRSEPPGTPDSVRDFTDAPAYVATQKEGPLRYVSLLHHVEWWLPVPEQVHLFATTRPNGERAWVSSVGMLRLELDVLRTRYGLSEEHLAAIRSAGPPPDDDPWNWGRFALAAMLPLVRWAGAAGHPVILHY